MKPGWQDSLERKTREATAWRRKSRRTEQPKSGIHAVARLAGVSISTVSRVVNGSQTVDADLTRRVWKAVAEIKYAPNRHAQALTSGRTRLMGLLVSEIVNPFFPELIQGFEQAAMSEGFSLLIGATYSDPDRTIAWVRCMLQYGIEGIALLTFESEPPIVFDLLRMVPTVQIAIDPKACGTGIIHVDFETGLRQAVQHLATLGHRDIVFAAGPSQNPLAAIRERCFRLSMHDFGVVSKHEIVFHEQHSLEGGMDAARRILDRRTLPTALICSNDLMAMGALRVFQSRKMLVPRDISVIGLDDIQLAAFTSPPLTTVKIPRMQLAQVCFDALMYQLETPNKADAEHFVVPTSLVVRESTSYPREIDTVGRRTMKTRIEPRAGIRWPKAD